jgi:protocatechuate 3,4-dioxygenase alpha subunit
MSAEPKLIPSSSQTVGPFFRIGLEYLIDGAPSPAAGEGETVTIRGQVLDRDRAPVPDALLEFWCAAGGATVNGRPADFPARFRRVATDFDGRFSVVMTRPEPVPMDDGTLQAPHMVVLVFARGLLRHLISRVYFDGEAGNGSDAVLNGIPAERRATLIAQADGKDVFRWNVILQGADETVFFAW